MSEPGQRLGNENPTLDLVMHPVVGHDVEIFDGQRHGLF